MPEDGVRDDSEEFTLFTLFDKLEKHPEDLTPIERIALRGYGIEL